MIICPINTLRVIHNRFIILKIQNVFYINVWHPISPVHRTNSRRHLNIHKNNLSDKMTDWLSIVGPPLDETQKIAEPRVLFVDFGRGNWIDRFDRAWFLISKCYYYFFIFYLVSSVRVAKRCEDDERTADGAAGEHASQLPVVPGEGQGVLRGVSRQTKGVHQAAVRHHVLPRRRPGTPQVRADRLEYTVRVQRVRLSHFHTAATGECRPFWNHRLRDPSSSFLFSFLFFWE